MQFQTFLTFVPSDLSPQAAKAQAESASTQKAEREVTRMVVVMILGFLVCWLPYASFALWVVNNRGAPFDLRLATIPACFSKSSAVYNPIIYVVLNKQVGDWTFVHLLSATAPSSGGLKKRMGKMFSSNSFPPSCFLLSVPLMYEKNAGNEWRR